MLLSNQEPTTQDEKGFLLAALQGDLGYVEKCLKKTSGLFSTAVRVNTQWKYVTEHATIHGTALHFACYMQHDHIVAALLADARVEMPPSVVLGVMPLHVAAGQGDCRIVSRLLSDCRTDVNCRGPEGHTPLMVAAEYGQHKVIPMLLSAAHLKANLVCNRGKTPLHYAAQAGHDAVIELLLSDRRTEVDRAAIHGGGATALALACVGGHISTVRLLLAAGADAGIMCNGQTIAAVAESVGHLSIKKLLEDHLRRTAPAPARVAPPALPPTVSRASAASGARGSSASHISTELRRFDPSDIAVGKTLGRGSFGEVFKVMIGHEQYAAKRITLTDEGAQEDFFKEARVLAKLSHPRIVRLYGLCVGSRGCYLIMALAHCSLYDLIHSESDLPWTRRIALAKDIAAGLAYLHSREVNMVHRDLKSPNVLVDGEQRAVIADFGLAKVREHGSTRAAGVGTILWSAPEVINNEGNTSKSDVYSYGVILAELATRKAPMEGKKFGAIIAEATTGDRCGELVKVSGTRFEYIIRRCWMTDPDERPEIGDILETLTGAETTAPVERSHGGGGGSGGYDDSYREPSYSYSGSRRR